MEIGLKFDVLSHFFKIKVEFLKILIWREMYQ